MEVDNPFIVLRLSANASAADIRAVGQQLAMRARLGASEGPEKARRVEAALEQLRDPVQRFLAGLEAPQLGSASAARFQSDARFASLHDHANADLSSAVQELVQGESEFVRQHAQGCFAIVQACLLLREATGPNVGAKALRARDAAKKASQLLESGLRDLRAAIGRPEFWMMQRMRAKQIDDPRLTPEKVQRIQDAFPEPMLQRLCKIAETALENGSGSAAAAVVRPIQAVMGSEPIAARCLGQVYRGLGQRIEAAIKQCEERVKTLTGPEAAPFDAAFAEFHKLLKCDLDLMLELGDLPGTIEERARDGAATLFRGLGVKAGNNAKACSTAIAALELAIRYAVSPQLKSNIEENLGTIKELSNSIGGRSDLGPIFQRMDQSQSDDDLRGFLKAIDELISRLGETHAGKWRELRTRVASALATQIFNLGVGCANSGQRHRAKMLFEEALSFETVPAERAIVQRALNQVNGRGQTGCLVPLALVLIPVLALAGAPIIRQAMTGLFALVIR